MSSTQAAIRIPTRAVHGGGASEFSWMAGAHRATIEDVTRRDLPRSSTGEPFKGYETTDGYELNIKLGSNVYLEDEAQASYAGNRKQFVTIVVQDGDRTIFDVDGTIKNAPFWKLQQSQRLLAALMDALGQTEIDGEDTVIADGALEALEAGQFNGSEIGYNVSVKGQYANVVDFFTA